MTSGDTPAGWADPVGSPPAGPVPPLQPGWPAAWPPPYGQVHGQPVPPTGYGQAPFGYPQPHVLPVPGSPYAPYPWAPVPVPPQRRGRGALRATMGVLALILVCSVLAVGGLYGYADHTGALDTRAAWRPGATPTDAPPAQNAPSSEWTSWVRRSVDEVVRGQANALLAADQAGYLAAVDPASTRLVAEHKRRFTVLRAMGLGVWTQAVSGAVKSNGTRSWDADIKVSYCFGDADCRSVQLVVATAWRFKNERLLMVDLKESGSTSNGPRPWETDDLIVATGKRVVVAATKVNQWRLAGAVKAAERAAAVADKFSKWEEPPSRYVIFLAGPSDWNEWYGHDQPEWAAAWAVPVGSTVTEVVIRTQVVRQAGLESLLTHELTHVTTLAGKRAGAGRSAWWLIEGVAEYATMIGESVRSFDGFAPTRSYVRGDWDGDPAADPPGSDASLDEAAARYGLAFLAVRRIADKYGQQKMLDFFGRIVHDDDNLDAAARAALGAAWTTVRADCARFIRTSVA